MRLVYPPPTTLRLPVWPTGWAAYRLARLEGDRARYEAVSPEGVWTSLPSLD